MASSGGCSALQGVRDYVQYNDITDDFVVGWRNYVWANRAWAEQKPYYAGQPYLHDFGDGFRAGYRDVAAGGNGCPPPLPPRNYWSWKYQSPEGQGKIAAWFSGYPHGAAYAEQEGVGNWRQIPVSYAIEQQYSPEFERGQILRQDGTYYSAPTEGWMPEYQGTMHGPYGGWQEYLSSHPPRWDQLARPAPESENLQPHRQAVFQQPSASRFPTVN